MRFRLSGILCCAVLAGCAPIQPPQPEADHPASPQATAAREADTDVLTVDEKNLPQTPPEMHQGMMHHGQGRMGGSAPTDRTAAAYTCPMHPEVMSDKPGKCPICGMNLVPKGGSEDE